MVGDNQSKGDDVHYNFEGNTIECKDGEVIRLSLVDFHMPNNQYTIDGNNSTGAILCSVNGTAMAAAVNKTLITRGNYYEVDDIAINFAHNLATALLALPGMPTGPAATLTSIVNNTLQEQVTAVTGFINPVATAFPPAPPPQTFATTLTGTPEKKLLDVTLTFSIAHTITNLKISCAPANGELYLVLGGQRDDTGTTATSFDVTIPTTATIRVKGFFPMQLITEPHVYLRCTLGQNGLESSILSSDEKVYNNDIVGSNILAKIARNTESFTYAGNQGGEFFLTLQQRKLNSIGLFLTDSKSRPFGRSKNSGRGTSAGLEDTSVTTELAYLKNTQNTLGNLYFTATLRIDIIKVSTPNKLQSDPPPFPPFPSKSNGVLWTAPTGFN